MKASRKRQLKRGVKHGKGIAIISLILLIIHFIFAINFDIYQFQYKHQLIIFIGSIILPAIAGLVGIAYSEIMRQKLILYWDAIHKYRARVFLGNTIQYLLDDRVNDAVNEFIKSNYYPEKDYANQVRGMVIQACYTSYDIELVKIGKNKMIEKMNKHLPSDYDPTKVYI